MGSGMPARRGKEEGQEGQRPQNKETRRWTSEETEARRDETKETRNEKKTRRFSMTRGAWRLENGFSPVGEKRTTKWQTEV
ncbi:hypothetical protein NDU88_004940 [Pleurodeles waltl]|uniref:Uncharacterized protein n=1 Tax=Pleurodeles waltl TaxID=8319 RepID=A0AAV7RMN6_PLEWA|nr:hypothetical protein NDU88_004940 [Pleurodeles waltl]